VGSIAQQTVFLLLLVFAMKATFALRMQFLKLLLSFKVLMDNALLVHTVKQDQASDLHAHQELIDHHQVPQMQQEFQDVLFAMKVSIVLPQVKLQQLVMVLVLVVTIAQLAQKLPGENRCPIGSYCPAGASKPTVCPAGTY
jgi:formate dehydrogenase maturation protein FdhE